MIKRILAVGHIAVDAAEIAGGEGRVHVQGVGANLNLDTFFPHFFHNIISVVRVDAERLPGVFSLGRCFGDDNVLQILKELNIICRQLQSAVKQFAI